MAPENKDLKCYLCSGADKDDVTFGEFLTKGQISVHYFCLLLSSNLCQSGEDDEGILGFLPKDIKQEKTRVSPLKCFYCKQKSANIGCCVSSCPKSFHLKCGYENQAVFHFEGTFSSYCDKHHGIKEKEPSSQEECSICRSGFHKYNSVDCILTPCCKSAWFHRKCLANFAFNSGYFFKCPLCNDSDIFRERLKRRGIFVPDKDAEWEIVPNAFSELLERPNQCAGQPCRVKGAPQTRSKSLEVIYCDLCGSDCIHKLCLRDRKETFICTTCEQILNKSKIDSHEIIEEETNTNSCSGSPCSSRTESDILDHLDRLDDKSNLLEEHSNRPADTEKPGRAKRSRSSSASSLEDNLRKRFRRCDNYIISRLSSFNSTPDEIPSSSRSTRLVDSPEGSTKKKPGRPTKHTENKKSGSWRSTSDRENVKRTSKTDDQLDNYRSKPLKESEVKKRKSTNAISIKKPHETKTKEYKNPIPSKSKENLGKKDATLSPNSKLKTRYTKSKHKPLTNRKKCFKLDSDSSTSSEYAIQERSKQIKKANRFGFSSTSDSSSDSSQICDKRKGSPSECKEFSLKVKAKQCQKTGKTEFCFQAGMRRVIHASRESQEADDDQENGRDFSRGQAASSKRMSQSPDTSLEGISMPFKDVFEQLLFFSRNPQNAIKPKKKSSKKKRSLNDKNLNSTQRTIDDFWNS